MARIAPFQLNLATTARRTALLSVVLVISLATTGARAEPLVWPENQLLPSFPEPAERQDLILLRAPEASEEEMTLFASLKGVVNRSEPRIFSYEGDAFAEGKYTWLESLGLTWTEYEDGDELLLKYKSEVAGLIVYDPELPATMNLATTLAGQRGALVAAPGLLSKLTSAPYNFTVLDDLRGDFANKLAVYDYLYTNVWPALSHRVVFGLSPQFHKASNREYAVALGAAVLWLDPNVSGESEMLNRFLSSMDPGGIYMGWWPEEAPGVERGSSYGIATVASDYATNLTLHSGMSREVAVKPIPPKPILENKIYVAFILSDGDNLQYVEHLMRKLWNNPDRGKVPIGWTVSPAMLDAMPGALNFYYSSSTARDNLISGPSGWGYGYPNFWSDQPALQNFAEVTDDYALRAGLRVVTIWNTITGGIDTLAGNTFAMHAPSILGLTGQNTGGGLTIYDQTMPGFALSCNYCTNEQAMKDHIASAASGFDGSAPRFILIQAQPWQGVTPTSFLNVQNSLSDEYRVLRPDNWFQLLRQTNGLRIEPHRPVLDGEYRLINRASGKCVSLSEGTAPDSPVVQKECADDDAQRWRVVSTQNGYMKLTALGEPKMVLDIAGGPGAIEEGNPTILFHDAGTANQEWQAVWEQGDDYHVLVRHSERCLDIPKGSTDDVQLRQWDCNGTAAQRFEFADPIWPPPVVTPEGPPVEEPPLPGNGQGGAVSGDLLEEGEGAGVEVEKLEPTACACSSAPGKERSPRSWLLSAGVLLIWYCRRGRMGRLFAGIGP